MSNIDFTQMGVYRVFFDGKPVLQAHGLNAQSVIKSAIAYFNETNALPPGEHRYTAEKI